MSDRDRRATAESLESLEKLIERMDVLGREAEDAAARVTELLRETLEPTRAEQRQTLLIAISDVIEVVTERSRLTHHAYRLMTDIRRREMEGWRRALVPEES
jgi:hypothetical protein